jgi:hypothetical protein
VVIDEIDVLGGLNGCDSRCLSHICSAEEPIHGILRSSRERHAPCSWEGMALLEAIARSLVLNRQDKYFRFQGTNL